MRELFRKIRYNVTDYPGDGRRLTGILEIKNPGRKLCFHEYSQVGHHEDGTGTVRYSVRHYECRKCHRLVFVDGRVDDISIEYAINKTQERLARKRK